MKNIIEKIINFLFISSVIILIIIMCGAYLEKTRLEIEKLKYEISIHKEQDK